MQIVQDPRGLSDLKVQYPQVDEDIVEEVWERTGLFLAAESILMSLINSNHHQRKKGEEDMAVDWTVDEEMWPPLLPNALEGWEHVRLPEEEVRACSNSRSSDVWLVVRIVTFD